MRLLLARVGRTFCRQCGREVGPRDGGGRGDATAARCRRARGSSSASTCRSSRHGDGRRRDAVDRRTEIAGADGATSSGSRRDAQTSASRRSGDAAACRRARIPTLAIRTTLDTLRRKGFGRLLVDGQAVTLEDVDPATLRDRRRSLQVVVDRIRVDGDLRARLTDSIETAYHEGGGAAWAMELPDARRRRVARARRPCSSPSASSAAVRHHLRGSAAAAVLVQQPVRRLPDVPRLRQHHRARHGSGRARSSQVDQTRARSSRGPSRTTVVTSPS